MNLRYFTIYTRPYNFYSTWKKTGFNRHQIATQLPSETSHCKDLGAKATIICFYQIGKLMSSILQFAHTNTVSQNITMVVTCIWIEFIVLIHRDSCTEVEQRRL